MAGACFFLRSAGGVPPRRRCVRLPRRKRVPAGQTRPSVANASEGRKRVPNAKRVRHVGSESTFGTRLCISDAAVSATGVGRCPATPLRAAYASHRGKRVRAGQPRPECQTRPACRKQINFRDAPVHFGRGCVAQRVAGSDKYANRASGNHASTWTPGPQVSTFSPTMPLTIRVRQTMRPTVAGSCSTSMPKIAVPTAPMPVHTA